MSIPGAEYNLLPVQKTESRQTINAYILQYHLDVAPNWKLIRERQGIGLSYTI